MLRQAIIFEDYLVLFTPTRAVLQHFLKINLDIIKKKHEIFCLVGFYAACSGNLLPTFRDNLSIPFSGVKKSEEKGGFGGIY